MNSPACFPVSQSIFFISFFLFFFILRRKCISSLLSLGEVFYNWWLFIHWQAFDFERLWMYPLNFWTNNYIWAAESLWSLIFVFSFSFTWFDLCFFINPRWDNSFAFSTCQIKIIFKVSTRNVFIKIKLYRNCLHKTVLVLVKLPQPLLEHKLSLS